jgi:NitT/TauT family transport system substrate-binding protein
MRAFIRGARFYNGALANGRLAGPNAEKVISIFMEETNVKDPTIFREVTPNGVNPNGRLYLPSMKIDSDFFKRGANSGARTE